MIINAYGRIHVGILRFQIKDFKIHKALPAVNQYVIINAYGRIHVGILRFQIKDFKIHRGVRSIGAMEARAPPKLFYVLDDLKKMQF